jgi:hypothetical protein
MILPIYEFFLLWIALILHEAAQRLDIDLRAGVDSAWGQEKLEARKLPTPSLPL